MKRKTIKPKEKMWILNWENRKGQTLQFTHQYEKEIYKFGEALINEGIIITVCPM